MDDGFNCLQAPSIFKIICFNINWIVDQSRMPYQIYDFYQSVKVRFFSLPCLTVHFDRPVCSFRTVHFWFFRGVHCNWPSILMNGDPLSLFRSSSVTTSDRPLWLENVHFRLDLVDPNMSSISKVNFRSLALSRRYFFLNMNKDE